MAAAELRWDDLLREPETAASALLLAAADASHGAKVVEVTARLLRRHASAVPSEDLDRLAVLAGVEQAQLKDMGYHDPVDCSEVNLLALTERERRTKATPRVPPSSAGPAPGGPPPGPGSSR
jgi:hypothetical protein